MAPYRPHSPRGGRGTPCRDRPASGRRGCTVSTLNSFLQMQKPSVWEAGRPRVSSGLHLKACVGLSPFVLNTIVLGRGSHWVWASALGAGDWREGTEQAGL